MFYLVCVSSCSVLFVFLFFFFNDTATTEIYTLSLHDALPILVGGGRSVADAPAPAVDAVTMRPAMAARQIAPRSEEHTSELQSQSNLVCRLLLEKKKKKKKKLIKNKQINITHYQNE